MVERLARHGRDARHSIDAAQQGFYKACTTSKALRMAGFPAADFPHWPKEFRTTIGKNSAFKRKGDTLELSTGRGNTRIAILLPEPLFQIAHVTCD